MSTIGGRKETQTTEQSHKQKCESHLKGRGSIKEQRPERCVPMHHMVPHLPCISSQSSSVSCRPVLQLAACSRGEVQHSTAALSAEVFSDRHTGDTCPYMYRGTYTTSMQWLLLYLWASMFTNNQSHAQLDMLGTSSFIVTACVSV